MQQSVLTERSKHANADNVDKRLSRAGEECMLLALESFVMICYRMAAQGKHEAYSEPGSGSCLPSRSPAITCRCSERLGRAHARVSKHRSTGTVINSTVVINTMQTRRHVYRLEQANVRDSQIRCTFLTLCTRNAPGCRSPLDCRFCRATCAHRSSKTVVSVHTVAQRP